MLVAINEISGHINHSEPCAATICTSRDARLPVYPEIQQYARALFKQGVSGPTVYSETNMWAQAMFPVIMTAFHTQYRFIYMPHDTTSLYCSLRLEMGIPQCSLAHNILHIWFHSEDASPPSPALSDACLYYQACVLGQTDQFMLILSTLEQRASADTIMHPNPGQTRITTCSVIPLS